MSKCASCTQRAIVGSRCIRCWVDRKIRYYGLIDHKWYRANRDRFVERLKARILAIEMDLEPGSIVQLKKTFEDSNHSRYNLKSSSPKTIEHIVALFDQIIKEKKNVTTGYDNSSSPKN